MNLFKRISTTVVSRIDGAVRGIENHDAIVGASLTELRRAMAQVRARAQRMQSERECRRQRRDQLGSEAARWRERAAESGDENTAIECLRRARAHDAEIASLERTDEQQRGVEQRMAEALERLEQRYSALQSQRHTLRRREAAAQAGATAERMVGGDSDALEETLERWAIDVTEDEIAADALDDRDELAERFDNAEQEAELRAELATLRNDNGEGQS